MKNNNIKVITKQIVLIMFFIVNFPAVNSAQKIIVGYYPAYASDVLPVQDIQFENLTHIIHGFVWPDSNGALVMYDGIKTPNLVSAAHGAGVKVMLALGGAGDEPTSGFEAIAGDSLKRSIFINNSVNLAVSLEYDGIDLDWEFPSTVDQKTNYTLFVKEIRAALNKIDSSLLLTMAASATSFYGQWTEYEKIIDDMDWFNLLAYEYNGYWSEKTGHNAPLYNWQDNADGNANASVSYLNVTRKIPKDKIVLGIPFYGKMYTASALNQTITKETTVIGLTYRDILDSLNSSYMYTFDGEAKVPYYISSADNRFISFDDTASVKIKTEYAVANGLKGVMIWEISQDRLSGGSQPLLEQIGKTMKAAPTAIIDETEVVQNDFRLYNNFPNPFNPSTIIKFSVPVSGFVSLKVYNSLGQEVSEIVTEYLTRGSYEKVFNAQGLSSGIYFYTLVTNNNIKTNKMLLLK